MRFLPWQNSLPWLSFLLEWAVATQHWINLWFVLSQKSNALLWFKTGLVMSKNKHGEILAKPPWVLFWFVGGWCWGFFLRNSICSSGLLSWSLNQPQFYTKKDFFFFFVVAPELQSWFIIQQWTHYFSNRGNSGPILYLMNIFSTDQLRDIKRMSILTGSCIYTHGCTFTYWNKGEVTIRWWMKFIRYQFKHTYKSPCFLQ